jgi:hypothetical protein
MQSFIKTVLAICVAGCVLMGGCVAVIGAGASSVDSGSDPSADTKARGGDENAAKTGTVGTPVTNAGTTYKVTDVKTGHEIGGQYGAKSNGVFVVVGLELTNNKDETKTFMDNSATLVTMDGNRYETSTDASIYLDDSLLLEDIQPDLTTRGHIGFDVPAGKVPGAKLVIEDIWGNGEVAVNLGL